MAWNESNPALTTKIKDGPKVFQDNLDTIEAWTDLQHYGLTCASSGYHKAGTCGVVLFAATALINAKTNVACATAYETTSADFLYNSGTAWVSLGGPIPQGTIMLFYQDTAPVGWTIAVVDDKVAFVTKGSGAAGQTGGGAHSTGTWTLAGHTHTIAAHNHTGLVSTVVTEDTSIMPYYLYLRYITDTHNHTISEQAEITVDANANETTWRPSSYCCIQCTKD